MALVGHISGSTQSNSVIGVSGSVIVANRPSATFPGMPGTNVTFFVSGSANTATDVSVFGGDLVVSGSFTGFGDSMELTGTLSVTNGISGSLTKLTDGTSYLVAGNNISITSQSNGSVLIAGTFTQTDDFFDSTTAGSIFTTGSAAFRGGESAVDSPADKGTDVFFYVSGSKDSIGGATPGVALFEGDVRVSGSVVVGTGSVKLTSNDVQFSGPSVKIEKAGNDLKFFDITNPSGLTLSQLADQGDDFFDSTTAGSIFTTGSAAFKGGEAGVDSPSDKGTDVFFYVSGSLDGSSKSLFGGSVVVSGSLDAKGNVTLGDTTSDTVTFNALVNTNVLPSADSTYNLGSATNRWANVYTGDLHLRNERGNWTVIEEETYLSLRNNDTGKVYRIVMEPVD